MITVSDGAGLPNQARDADELWRHDVDKQWRKPRMVSFSERVWLKYNGAFFGATAALQVRITIFGENLAGLLRSVVRILILPGRHL
jgi:hypothetical protein